MMEPGKLNWQGWGMSRLKGWLLGVFVVTLLPAEVAWSQGPLRRLGERVRERAAGPLIQPPGPVAPVRQRRLIRPPQPSAAQPGPAQPGSGAEPAVQSPPAQPSRGAAPLAQRPPSDPRFQAARPPFTAPGSQAGNAPIPSRSANFNRASAALPRTATSGVEQPSGVEQSSAAQPYRDDSYADDVFGDGAAQPGVPQLPLAAGPMGWDQESRRGRLGVVVDTPPQSAVPGQPPSRPRGAMVTEVLPQSSAAVAGLRPGDVIVAIDGRLVTSVRDMVDELARYAAGEEVLIQYSRGNTLNATPATLAGPDGIAPQVAQQPAAGAAGAGDQSILGGIGSMFGGLLGGQRADQPRAGQPRAGQSQPGQPNPSQLGPGEPMQAEPPLSPQPPLPSQTPRPAEDALETLPAPLPEPR